jgi:hypothetical protein
MPFCAKCKRKLSHNYCILNNGEACHEECLPKFHDAYILPDGEKCQECGEIQPSLLIQTVAGCVKNVLSRRTSKLTFAEEPWLS